MWLSRSLAAVACVAAMLAVVSQAAAAQTPQRSAAEINARWLQLQPVYEGTPYVVAPTLSAPFAAGSLQSGLLQDGLNSINYARFLAGLPDDVALDATYTDRAQHGAVLLAVGSFAHSQPKPSTMATDFYMIANAATSSSNIGWGYSSLWDFNVSCLGDEDSGNIDRVGHRRWILNPPLQKTGMGMASSRTDTYVFDWSRSAAVDYDSVKWPSAGYFPVEMFGTDVPWSVTLNPSLYSWSPGTAGHTVTLRRVRDGRTWTFNSADTNKSGEYFNFETNGYGVANCFIFRPDPTSVGGYLVGDAFDVTISGGITNKAGGTPATVSYRTQFVSQTASAAPPAPKSAAACYLTRPKAPSKARRNRLIVATGKVYPAHAVRVRVEVRRLSRGHYRAYRSLIAYADSTGGWKLKTKLPRGTFRMRATTSATLTYRAGVSACAYVRVR
jgi:uncharacterized protein YkwD